MKRTAIGICLLSALSGAALAAQLYRWVDDKGNVEWRDTPPPPTAKKVEQRKLTVGAPETAAMPYNLQMAIKNYPVTLWTSNCGQACDQAKAHLARRGTPYTEKNAQADFPAFQKATSGSEVPVLFVGSTQLRGFQSEQWDSVLDAAGYPKTPVPGAPKPVVQPVVTPAPAEGQPEAPPAAAARQ